MTCPRHSSHCKRMTDLERETRDSRTESAGSRGVFLLRTLSWRIISDTWNLYALTCSDATAPALFIGALTLCTCSSFESSDLSQGFPDYQPRPFLRYPLNDLLYMANVTNVPTIPQIRVRLYTLIASIDFREDLYRCHWWLSARPWCSEIPCSTLSVATCTTYVEVLVDIYGSLYWFIGVWCRIIKSLLKASSTFLAIRIKIYLKRRTLYELSQWPYLNSHVALLKDHRQCSLV